MATPTLGLNFGTHDAAAAITLDGAVVAAAEEERFTRIKHTKAFPILAIEYCLKQAGLEPSDIGRIALFVDPKLQLLLPVANFYHAFPASLGSFASDVDKYHKRKRLLAAIRSSEICLPGVEIVPIRHHAAHAASAYLTAPFEHATVVTLSAWPEVLSVTLGEPG